MLVGRQAEQAVVDAVLRDALSGRARVLDIEGEPGIGKSAMLEACVDDAKRRGASVLFGRCDELGQGRPFAPLLDAGMSGGIVDLSGIRDEQIAASISARSAPLESGPEVRSLLVDRIVTTVEQRCVERPLVLAIDDVQWADGPTLITLASVVRRCADLPLLIAFTRRPHPRSTELRAFLEFAGAGSATGSLIAHLDLAPLDADDVARLAGLLTGSRPGADLLAMLTRCDGNPLLVVETVASLRDEGALVIEHGTAEPVKPGGGDLPVTLRENVQARMARLEGEIRALAAIAALLGSRFTLADLAAVTARPTTELFPFVEELIDARLLVDDGTALSFRHDLVRETVAAALPASIRHELHQRIADALREAGAPVARVAEHVALAAPSDPAAAVAVLRAAAAEILPQDPVRATRLLRRALELCSMAEGLRDEVLAQLVDALAWSGRTGEAQSLAAEALTRPLPPEVEERLRSGLGRSLLLLGRPHDAIEHEERVIELRDALGQSTAWACAECAMCRLFSVDLDGALTNATAAVELAERDGDAMASILALCVQVFARNTVGDTAAAVELGERAVRIADRTPGGEGHRLHPHLFRGIALQTLGDHQAAAAAFRHGRAQGEALGADWGLPLYNFVTALAHWDEGNWDNLLAEVEAGITFGEEKGSTIAQVWAFAVSGLAHLHRGDLSLAAAALDRGDAVLASGGLQYGIDWLVLARALLLEAEGKSGEAFETLRFAWEAAVGLQAIAALTTFGPELARLSLAAGDREFGEEVATLLEDTAARNADDPLAVARSQRARGLVADDPGLLLDAVRSFDRLGHTFEVATVRFEAAEALLRAGERERAVPLFEEALAVFDRVGAIREADQLRTRLAQAHLRSRREPPVRAVEGWEALTPTEREVVEEVCAGRSNGDVADRLGVSRRTVEAHLRSVYTKLQVRTRLALAVADRERRGLAD